MSTSIQTEISRINELFTSYGYDYNILGIARLFYNDKSHTEGDLIKNIYYNIRLLKYAGFSMEEALAFLIQHKNFMFENMNMFNLKCAILNKVGLLNAVLKNNPTMLGSLNKLSAKRLYALLCYIKARGQEISYESLSNVNLPVQSMDRLAEQYNLNDEVNSVLVKKLNSDIEHCLQ